MMENDKERHLSKTLRIIYIISFCDLLAVGLIFPVFNNHLRNLGASFTLIGIINSTYSGIQVVSGPIIGGWSDIRSRKYVLKRVILICSLCYGLLGLVNSLAIIFLIRVILGSTKHIQNILKAVVADAVHDGDQSGKYGKSVAFGSLGFIIGPLISGILAETYYGFTYVCLLTMCLFLSNLVLVSYLPCKEDSSKNIRNERKFNIMNELKESVTKLSTFDWKKHWLEFLIRFCFGLTLSCYSYNEVFFMKAKYGLSPKYRGYLISLFSVVAVGSALILEYINKFFDSKDVVRQIIFFFSILSITLFGMYISGSIYVFLMLLIPFSIACTILRILTADLVFKVAPKSYKGSISGTTNSVMSISRFITPLLSGLGNEVLSEDSAVLLALLPSIFGLCFSYLYSVINYNCMRKVK